MLEIHTERIPLRSNGGNILEHYGKYFDEKYNVGLVRGHYFINGFTELTSYCLEHYEDVKDIKGCNNIIKEVGGNCLIKKMIDL